MNNENKKINAKIYQLGHTMGLNKKDINSILNDISSISEQPSHVAGPYGPPYMANLYGTINIKDIQSKGFKE